MNIVTANRLIEFRKRFGYSQEELADKLGISRQSVSKWERSEASPDTDNLIELSKIYGISLDDLLNTDKDIDDVINNKKKDDSTDTIKEGIHITGDDGEEVHISGNGIHITDDGDEVHITRDGIHVKSDKEEASISGNGIIKHGIKFVRKHHKLKVAEDITTSVYTLASVIAYLVLGFTFGARAWIVGWTLFLLIPVIASIFETIRKHRLSVFCYPVLVTYIYCVLGLLFGLWHPYWVLFITIPAYYAIVEPIDNVLRKKHHLDFVDEDDD